MNKRRLYHIGKLFRHIHPWYFLVITVVFGVISVLALRANNEHMVELRQAVYLADKNNTDVQKPLKALQAYVTTHMNTNLSAGPNAVYPPIQLKYTYNRLVTGQGSATADANSKIYNDAQHYCEQQNPTDFSGRNRVPCIEQYVQDHQEQAAQSIPDALYKFSFISPTWSPDLAGWSLVITAISGTLFVISFVVKRWFKKNI